MSEPNIYYSEGIQRRGNIRNNPGLTEEIEENVQLPFMPLGSLFSGKVDHILSLFCCGELKQCCKGGLAL